MPHDSSSDLPRWQRVPATFTRAFLALLNQFHLPVITFVAVTIIGGIIYGELHAIAFQNDPDAPVSTDTIPLIDRPYTMLQLMILETPPMYDETPSEWYLISFWYGLPLVFVFIVGNGVADFVRIFFGDTWRIVRLSNWRGHVIVLGAGHVGLRVVRWLREWGESVVVIDNDITETKREALQEAGVEIIIGDGRSAQSLKDANIENAAAFITATGDDTVNLYATMRARALNPRVHIVVRVWDDSFNEQISSLIVDRNQPQASSQEIQAALLSSSDIAAPVFSGLALGIELTQKFSISGMSYAAVRFVVQEGSIVANRTIEQIQFEHNADVVLYQSRQKHFQVRPPRDILVTAGDTLVLFAPEEVCINIAKNNYATEDSSQHVIVLGAGHVGLRIIRLLRKWNVRMTLIDNDIEPPVRDALNEIFADYDRYHIVETDGRDAITLKNAGIDTATAFIAATGEDATNLYAIMRVRALNPDIKIVVRVWDDTFNQQIDEFIVRNDDNTENDPYPTITTIRSSANIAAPIFAGTAVDINLTQTLLVHDYENDIDLHFAAVRIRAQHGSHFLGRTIGDIQTELYDGDKRADVVLHSPADSQPLMPPPHHGRVTVGDVLVIFAELDVCVQIARRNNRELRKARMGA
ncbi:MAG: NAD-binding protein [Chloroflexota bacterium]